MSLEFRLSLPCCDLELEWYALRLCITKGTIVEALDTFKPQWFYNRQIRGAFVRFRDAKSNSDRRRAARIMNGKYLADRRKMTAAEDVGENPVAGVAVRLRQQYTERVAVQGIREVLGALHCGQSGRVVELLAKASEDTRKTLEA